MQFICARCERVKSNIDLGGFPLHENFAAPDAIVDSGEFGPFRFSITSKIKENLMAQVLVVDDSSTVRNEVCAFLKDAGLSVIPAVDGKDGLEKLRANPSIKLVVSDVNMPNMDGLTMAEKIRGDLKNPSVNIVMLTTENSPAIKERGKAAGIKGWIVKPFNGAAVISTFKKLAS